MQIVEVTPGRPKVTLITPELLTSLFTFPCPGGGGGVPLLLHRGRVQQDGHRRGGQSGRLGDADGHPAPECLDLDVEMDTLLTTDCWRQRIIPGCAIEHMFFIHSEQYLSKVHILIINFTLSIVITRCIVLDSILDIE